MANNPITTPITILVDRAKIGEATDGSFKIQNGVDRIPTTDAIAFSLGKTVSEVTFKTIVPRAGMKARLYESVISKKDVKIQFTMDSKAYEIQGKFTSAGADWDVASGKLTGDFSFSGGEPVVLG